jgi:hypothetical protein
MTSFWALFVIGLLFGLFAGSVVGFFFGWQRGNANGSYHAGEFWKRKSRDTQ